VSSHSFAKRYQDSLLGTRSPESRPPPERVSTGYSLWHRYWTSLLGIRLRKPVTDEPSHPGQQPTASGTAGSGHAVATRNKVARMSPARTAKNAVQRHSWVSKATGWLPRVGELADPVQLGVHRAPDIDASAVDAPDMAESVPPYVPRDIDVLLDTAIPQGGLILLVGDSAAGKSRAAYEAMRRLLRDKWLLVPRSPESLRELASSGVELADTVVWLDNFERYLGPRGLDVALLHSLTGASAHYVVVLATMRTSEYFAWSPGQKQGPGGGQGHDLMSERQLLGQDQWVVYIERRLSQSEYQRATKLTSDPRIAAALERNKDEGWAILSRRSLEQESAQDDGSG
jgi:hypothetical protein